MFWCLKKLYRVDLNVYIQVFIICSNHLDSAADVTSSGFTNEGLIAVLFTAATVLPLKLTALMN